MATTFDPFREMDRFFSAATRTPASTAMPMDLFRDGEHSSPASTCPGVDPSTIDVDVEDRTMTCAPSGAPSGKATSSGSRTSGRAAPSPAS